MSGRTALVRYQVPHELKGMMLLSRETRKGFEKYRFDSNHKKLTVLKIVIENSAFLLFYCIYVADQ